MPEGKAYTVASEYNHIIAIILRKFRMRLKYFLTTQHEIFIFLVFYCYIICSSGSVQWEIKLEGRVECSAAILSDFTQVVFETNFVLLTS